MVIIWGRGGWVVEKDMLDRHDREGQLDQMFNYHKCAE